MAIRVGKTNPKRFDSLSGKGGAVKQPTKFENEEEKEKFINGLLGQLPKSKWVSALLSAGLEAEAKEYERSLAEEHLHEMNRKRREERLREIQALPLDEQLSLLLAEGYDDEAKELSERLAASQEEQAGDRDGDNAGEEAEDVGNDDGAADGGAEDDNPDAPAAENAGTDNVGAGDADSEPVEVTDQAKKKVGRPKKNAGNE